MGAGSVFNFYLRNSLEMGMLKPAPPRPIAMSTILTFLSIELGLADIINVLLFYLKQQNGKGF